MIIIIIIMMMMMMMMMMIIIVTIRYIFLLSLAESPPRDLQITAYK